MYKSRCVMYTRFLLGVHNSGGGRRIYSVIGCTNPEAWYTRGFYLVSTAVVVVKDTRFQVPDSLYKSRCVEKTESAPRSISAKVDTRVEKAMLQTWVSNG